MRLWVFPVRVLRAREGALLRQAARCSNARQRHPYRGLLPTWRELACPPDRWQPEPCILEEK